MADNDPADLRDLLNKPLGDYPDLPDLPGAKSFYGKLLNVEADHSKNKQTPLFRFFVRLTDPGKDVTPDEMKKISDAGFSLADYTTTTEYYLTPNAMRMFRRFLESLGFSTSLNFVEALKLDQNCLPTQETQDLIRGKDVLCVTPAPDQNGRVYNRFDRVAGVNRS